MNKLLTSAAVASAFAALPLSAGAATFLGSSITNGLSTQTLTDSGVAATFTAYSNASSGASGTFEKKTIAGYTAVGVAGGRTGGEIDINDKLVTEGIKVQFGASATPAVPLAQGITSIGIAFLYDGPEFGDWNEIAVITTNTNVIGKLTSTYTAATGLTAYWDVIGDAFGPVAVTNLSPAVDPGGAAVWNIVNPFGNALYTSLMFTAEASTVCGGPGTTFGCDNQSDYSLYSLSTALPPNEIPEPSTYLMMLAGLGMLGFMMKRRANG